MKPKNPNAVALGTLGGKAGRGAAKARTVEQCRRAQKAAVRARLAKGRANNRNLPADENRHD